MQWINLDPKLSKNRIYFIKQISTVNKCSSINLHSVESHVCLIRPLPQDLDRKNFTTALPYNKLLNFHVCLLDSPHSFTNKNRTDQTTFWLFSIYHLNNLKGRNKIGLGDFGSNGLLQFGELVGHHEPHAPEKEKDLKKLYYLKSTQ